MNAETLWLALTAEGYTVSLAACEALQTEVEQWGSGSREANVQLAIGPDGAMRWWSTRPRAGDGFIKCFEHGRWLLTRWTLQRIALRLTWEDYNT